MKRLFCLLVLLLFPFVSLADEFEPLYVGKWIHTEYDKSGDFHFIILDLQEDHTAICIFGESDPEDFQVPGRSFIGTWSPTSKGIHVVSGMNSSKDLSISDNDFLIEKYSGLVDLYSRIPEYDSNDASNGPVSLSMLETGVQIPTGTYIIGDDIPAGIYRFDMNKLSSTVKYYDQKSSLFPSTLITLDARSKTYSRLPMEEGAKLIIEGSSVILSYSKSLFE